MMPGTSKVIITDTSCFSLLQKLDAMDILHQLFADVITTTVIATEFRFPLPDWVQVKNVENKWLQHEYERSIDPGEASAIALASEILFDYLILDDADARRFAEKLGLPVTGTIGLLVVVKEKGLIASLRSYFERIQQNNFHISLALLERILKDAGE